MCTHMHECKHAYIHMYIYIYICTHTHKRTYTHKYHTRAPFVSWYISTLSRTLLFCDMTDYRQAIETLS